MLGGQRHKPHLKLYKLVKAAGIGTEVLADVFSSWVSLFSSWLEGSLAEMSRVACPTLGTSSPNLPRKVPGFSLLECQVRAQEPKRAPLALQDAHHEGAAAGTSHHQGVPHHPGTIMDFFGSVAKK